jgi:hypothetical protein
MKVDMNCSFTEKMRRVEYRELNKAKLLQDQVIVVIVVISKLQGSMIKKYRGLPQRSVEL